MSRRFYVCSYGGSGSRMLQKYLSNFGKAYHVHSRNPPLMPQKSDEISEFFDGRSEDMRNSQVIFIFKDPIQAIASRFWIPEHPAHIQCKDPNVTIQDAIDKQEDVWRIEEFFNNYVIKNKNRTYPIYCVNYHKFFNNIIKFNEVLKIRNVPATFPIKQETEREYINELVPVYSRLIERIHNIPIIQVV